MHRVPFNLPLSAADELQQIERAIASRKLSGDGPFNALCQALISEVSGGGQSFTTPSCTASLEMAAILTAIKPGDEVIMPSYTFVSTANAFVLRGGVPVFVDIRPDSLNIDERLVEAAIGPRTKAIVAVHYAGVPADMDALRDIATRHKCILIEDAAQGLGSSYRGRPVGGLGDMAAFSFHETKNIVSGEGGALVINDQRFVERAEIIREKGTDRSKLLKGLVDKYNWVDIGSSYLISELVAAFLYVQLQNYQAINAERRDNWSFYNDHLSELINLGFRLPFCPADCTHNAHLFYVIAPSDAIRDELISRLREDMITAPFHYIPLHSSPAGRRFSKAAGPMEVTDDLSARLLRLPLFRTMGEMRDLVVERTLFHARAITSERR